MNAFLIPLQSCTRPKGVGIQYNAIDPDEVEVTAFGEVVATIRAGADGYQVTTISGITQTWTDPAVAIRHAYGVYERSRSRSVGGDVNQSRIQF